MQATRLLTLKNNNKLYRSETFSSLGYTLPRKNSKDNGVSQNGVNGDKVNTGPNRYTMQQNWVNNKCS